MTKLEKKTKALNQLKKDLPVIFGSIVLDFIDSNFAAQGFRGNTLIPWRKTKSGKRNTFGKNNAGILVGRGKLRKSFRSIRTGGGIILKSGVAYAKVHNEGFEGTVSISAHTRRKMEVQKIYSIKTKKGRKKRVHVGDTDVTAHQRTVKIPMRKFIGDSPILRKMLADEIHRRLREIDRL